MNPFLFGGLAGYVRTTYSRLLDKLGSHLDDGQWMCSLEGVPFATMDSVREALGRGEPVVRVYSDGPAPAEEHASRAC